MFSFNLRVFTHTFGVRTEQIQSSGMSVMHRTGWGSSLSHRHRIQHRFCPSLTIWTDSRPVCLFSHTKLLQLFLHRCCSAARERSCCQPHQQEERSAPPLQLRRPPPLRIHLLAGSVGSTLESRLRSSFKATVLRTGSSLCSEHTQVQDVVCEEVETARSSTQRQKTDQTCLDTEVYSHQVTHMLSPSHSWPITAWS